MTDIDRSTVSIPHYQPKHYIIRVGRNRTILYATMMNFFLWGRVSCLVIFVTQVHSGTYLSPSSGFFVAPVNIAEANAPKGYLNSVFSDFPDILKCLPRFLAGKISSGTESAVLSMTQPANNVITEKMMEEGIIKCLGGTSGSVSDAAEVFMRKLGNKIVKEDDWRVAGKSLLIMHQVLTLPSINGEVIKELAEHFLDRYGSLSSAVQKRMKRSESDDYALRWVHHYLEYLRSLSEVIRRSGGGLELQDFRSLLRLSSGYCGSASRLLEISTGTRLSTATISASSKSFFLQLSGSCNALVRSDVKSHAESLSSLKTSASGTYSLQQESLSEIQRHAKDIRGAISLILERAQHTTPTPSIGVIFRGGRNSRYSASSRGSLSRKSKEQADVACSEVSWVDNLADMQCSLNRVVFDTQNVVKKEKRIKIVSTNSIRMNHPSTRKRSRSALVV